MPFAGSRISVRSRFRSAASERWLPHVNRTLPGWVSARSRRVQWQISCRPALRACCSKMFQQTRKYLQDRIPAAPSMGVVLGSGLGGFADELTNRVEVPYSEIPGWPRSTAIGHAGKLVFGQLETTPLAVLSGRAHLYEGYSPGRVTYAMRVLKLLGAKSVVLTNAAG